MTVTKYRHILNPNTNVKKTTALFIRAGSSVDPNIKRMKKTINAIIDIKRVNIMVLNQVVNNCFANRAGSKVDIWPGI